VPGNAHDHLVAGAGLGQLGHQRVAVVMPASVRSPALWLGPLFSGVIAQDNWVIFPALALGALAVRALFKPDK
jgi:hypothetical protein